MSQQPIPARQLVAPAEGRADVLGGALAYTRMGTGPVLLFIHGLGGTRHTWRHLMAQLADDFTVIAVDLPGHGDSDPPAGDYSLGAHATAVRDLLVALGLSTATIVGHSLGGGVALQFGYQFPERTERLILVSSGGLGPEVSGMLRAATLPGAKAAVAVLAKIPEALSRTALGLMPGSLGRDDVRLLAEGLRSLSGRQQRRSFVGTARTVINWRGQSVSAKRQLRLLTDLPLLIAWGSADRTIPPQHHLDLAKELVHASTVEIIGAGHYPQETAPGQLVSRVAQFVRSSHPFHYTEDRWRELLMSNQPGALPLARLSG